MNDSLRELDRSRQFYLVAALHTKEKELGNARLPGGPRRDCSEWQSARMVSLPEVLPSPPLSKAEEVTENQEKQKKDHHPISQHFYQESP